MMIVAGIVLGAVGLDRLFGEPKRWHPLVGFGRLVSKVEQALHPGEGQPGARGRGVLALCLLLLPSTLIAYWLSHLAYIGTGFSVLCLYLALGGQSLQQHGAAVAQALDQGDLPLARQQVGMIVSRDTSALNETEVAQATIESVLENGSDAIFAALFWFLLLGAPGVVLYRLANTLDAMWGYRTPRYHAFGWAAARFDDVLNYLPARLTALTYLLVGQFQSGWQCWRTQAATWYSPNAGPVMAAGAGALQISLGGAACYHGQLKSRPILGMGAMPHRGDIYRALALVQRGLLLWLSIVLLLALTGVVLGGWHA